jgi:hypothetical protein
MKKYITLLTLILLWNFSNSQIIKPLKNISNHINYNDVVYYKDIYNYFTPFLGNWKYVNGNKTFIVTLWKATKTQVPYNDMAEYYVDEIYGTYRMVQDYGLPNEQTLYTSIVNIPGSAQQRLTVIVADVKYKNKLCGRIYDVAGPYDPQHPIGINNFLNMTINTGSFPLTALWKVSLDEELFGSTSISIPSNVTLTKM